ncbi:hypothetical protein M422DRAFT_272640 [Sphaerobolus stellatus SS14]|uniref:Unplaced genomic scaffold SPHSTscaffold_300, whole genome shotgun sequence n=1 Tax=Sphaerobolus stellatus (strain SS14) TaxID=990650 RepID=A0A0C9ULG0_SPHS4|nr:hypothetical protein M422DRAFT_272640 [Sphaerobolus stellatus SS14]
MVERGKVIARKEKREAEQKAERERLQRIKDQERDEKVARELEGRKRKQSEKDVGDPTLKKKKRAPKTKSAPTIAELDDEDGSQKAKIIAANRKMLSKKGIDIVSEDSLGVVHLSLKFSGEPREEPCNRCRYWVVTRGCVTWICRDVVGRKVCATCTASNVSCTTTGEAIQHEKKGGEIFDRLGFMEADLDTIRQTVGELQDLTRIQVMSQLLTYRLFKANNTIRPPGFQEQREEYRQSVTSLFRKDHLGEDKGLSGALGGEGEEDASGKEESEIEHADKTLGRDDDVTKGKGIVPENVSDEELEMGGEGEESGEGSETEGEKATPRAKTAGPSIVESEESEETSEATSGEEEKLGGESEETGNYLPVKGKKSGKQATKD